MAKLAIIRSEDAPDPPVPKRLVISDNMAYWARQYGLGYIVQSALAIQMAWRLVPLRMKREIHDEMLRRNALTLAVRRGIHTVEEPRDEKAGVI